MTASTLTEKYLVHLFHDAGLGELCHMADRRLEASHHKDAHSLLTAARALHRTGNLFTTLNRIDPGKWLAYVAESRQVDPGKIIRTPDSCITRYCRLFFDFDPARPKGQSSTAEELATAAPRARGLVAKLTALGWPAPLLAMSGNGWHVQYRTALVNNPETAEMLKAIYIGLAAEFDDDEVMFDKSVRNPARLCALYGAIKRKGIDHPERPHRQSYCEIPEPWLQVHPRQVAGLAEFYAAQAPAPATSPPPTRTTGPKVAGRGDFASLDVVAWFLAHKAYVGPLAGNVHGARCPWSYEHSTPSPKTGSDTIIFEADGGWPGFSCKHGHCADRDIRAVMALWGDADAFCGAAFQPVRRVG
ncbi:MAG: hypothetical protein KA204_07520 [Chromatiaceae bacterium]|nr:hypothetical protein [Chromatiaceae bacterium]MBP6733502.1 hypothetical protein [Chromatiaceae bacterium]MBP6806928.1 hypothetical protein [Chromatiaceae bacterium]MBP8288428.1 hypothetical protein [Chromatiaceae bacterium]MBP9602744.1 hypothetical protein [Chromatiaceae bacterium]